MFSIFFLFPSYLLSFFRFFWSSGNKGGKKKKKSVGAVDVSGADDRQRRQTERRKIINFLLRFDATREREREFPHFRRWQSNWFFHFSCRHRQRVHLMAPIFTARREECGNGSNTTQLLLKSRGGKLLENAINAREKGSSFSFSPTRQFLRRALSLSSCLSNSSGKGICSHWSGSNDVIELRERELLYRSRTGAITQEMRSVEGKEGIHFLSHLTRRIGFDEEKGEPVIIIITGLWPSPSVCGDCGQCTTKACQRWKPIQEVASRSDIIIPLLRYTQTLGLIRWKEMNPRQNKSDDPTTTNKKNFFSSGFLYQRGGQWRQIKRLRQLLPVLLVRAWKEAILLELLLLTLWFGACVSADILFFWLFFFFFFSCIAFSRLPFHSLSLATVHGRLGSVLLSLLLLLSSHYGARRGWTLVTYLVSHLLAAGATTGKGKCFIVCLLIASLRCAIIILHASRFGCDRVTNQIRIASTVLTWVYSHTARTWQSNRLLPVPTQSFFEKKKYFLYK